MGMFFFIAAAVICFLTGADIFPVKNAALWALCLIAVGLAVGSWWPKRVP